MTQITWTAPPLATPPENVLGACFTPHFQHVLGEAGAWTAGALAQDETHGPALVVHAAIGFYENAPDLVARCEAAARRYAGEAAFIEHLATRLHQTGNVRPALDILYDYCLVQDRLIFGDLALQALMYKGDLERLFITEKFASEHKLFAKRFRSSGAQNQAPSAKMPIFMATLARSGTAFMANTMARATGWPFLAPCSRTYPRDSFVYHDLIAEQKGRGSVYVSHLSPSREAMQSLAGAGIDRIYVHVRDPRQATLSWLHYLDQRFAESEDEWLRYLGLLSLPDDYRQWEPAQKLHWLTRNYFPRCVNWIERWQDAVLSTADVEIRFGDYADFRADQLDYMNAILAFFQTGHILTPKDLPSREEKVVHYRSADQDEWRQRFASEDIDTMTAAIPVDTAKRFGWTL